MKCQICGRDFVALGVHVRRKHGVDPDEYREEFGLMKTTPLVSKELSEHLSVSAKIHHANDQEYREAAIDRCKINAEFAKGKTRNGSMSKKAKDGLSKRTKALHEKYIKESAKKAADILSNGGLMYDVKKATGSGYSAIKKMATVAGIEYSKKEALAEQKRRAAKAQREKAQKRVAKMVHLLDTTRSAAEMCRQAGISIKTYKNWLKAGLIKRHPNGRYKKPIPPAS